MDFDMGGSIALPSELKLGPLRRCGLSTRRSLMGHRGPTEYSGSTHCSSICIVIRVEFLLADISLRLETAAEAPGEDLDVIGTVVL